MTASRTNVDVNLVCGLAVACLFGTASGSCKSKVHGRDEDGKSQRTKSPRAQIRRAARIFAASHRGTQGRQKKVQACQFFCRRDCIATGQPHALCTVLSFAWVGGFSEFRCRKCSSQCLMGTPAKPTQDIFPLSLCASRRTRNMLFAWPGQYSPSWQCASFQQGPGFIRQRRRGTAGILDSLANVTACRIKQGHGRNQPGGMATASVSCFPSAPSAWRRTVVDDCGDTIRSRKRCQPTKRASRRRFTGLPPRSGHTLRNSVDR